MGLCLTVMQRLPIILSVLAMLSGATVPAQAFELRWNDQNIPEDTSRRLGSASLLGTLKSQGTADAQDILGAAQADYARLVAALYDDGFYAPVISITLDGREASAFSPIEPPAQVTEVVVRIETGPRFSFGNVAISPRAREAEAVDGFQDGAPAKLSVIRDVVASEIDGWRDDGHAKAEVGAQQITARHPARKLDVAVRITPGPTLKFGKLILEGDSDVRDARLRDIAGLPTGRTFSPDELERVATRLRRTGTFDAITLSEANDIGPDDTLDVTLQVVDRLPRRFGFGAEVSSQEGLELSAFWLHRNLFGGAERLRIEGDIGGIGGDSGGEDYTLFARYSRPATFNEDTDFFALAELESLDEPSYTSRKFALQAGIKRYATARREYTLALGLEDARTTDALGDEDYTILTAPMTVQFDYRDDTLDPKEGYFALAELTPFLGLDGTSDGAVFEFDGRAYYTVPAVSALTFALRGQVGAVIGPEAADAPADFLFFSGGGGTVRGQEYQSLGIDVGGGDQIGGSAFLGLSAEARYALNDDFGLVAFYDSGFIGSGALGDTGTGEWHAGAGLGLRYNTGIGPIRLDVAVPMEREEDASAFQVYVGIGQSF